MLYQIFAAWLSQSRLARGSRNLRDFTKERELLAKLWSFAFKVQLKADFPLTFHKLVGIFLAGCLCNVLATQAYAQVTEFVFVQFAQFNMSLIDHLANHANELSEFPATLVYSVANSFVSFEQSLFNTYGPRQIQASLLALAMAGCFAFAFGLQILFMRWCFKKAGITSFTKSIALNLDSVNGSWKKVLLYVLLFAVLVFAPAQWALELIPRGVVVDPAAQYLKTLSGVFWWITVFLMVVVGPVLEEIIFRGVLMNGLRASIMQLRLPRWSPQILRKLLELRLFQRIPKHTFANIFALVASSLIFAACHLTMTGFPDLTITALVCGWLYLRSGTLWCPILLHVLNNLVTLVVTNWPLITNFLR